MKAWKEEQDRIKAEEEEKERVQSAKRARSAQKRVSAANQDLVAKIFSHQLPNVN